MLKIYNERYSDFNSMIERYEREMREVYGLRRKSNEETPATGGTCAPAAEPENVSLESPAPPELEPVPFPESPGRPGPEEEQPPLSAASEPEPRQEQDAPGYVPRDVPETEEAPMHDGPPRDEEPRPAPLPIPEEPTEPGEREETGEPEGDFFTGEGNMARSHLPIDSGYIIVSTNSGRDAIPIAGVTVVIDRLDEHDRESRQELVAVLITNQSGRTEAVKVETVSRALSQSPGDSGPFMTYYVSARHPGYYPVINRPVDVFGGETSLMELELVPLPENLSGGNDNG